jgi:uncharacterized repeat protein (TIGR02543 family)
MFSGLSANGGSTTTTELTLSFSADITGLAAGDIIITAGNTGAARGELARADTGIYRLGLTGIGAAGGITVAVVKAGYAIVPASKDVTVYFVTPQDAAKAVTEALDAIGAADSVTGENKETAEEVVTAYDSLSDEAKALVSEEDKAKIEAIREKLDSLDTDDDEETPENYVVSFNTRGGSSVAGVSAAGGEKLEKPKDPLREGYTFAGWYKEETCINAWNFDTDTVTGKITLYAKWTAIPFGTSDLTLTLPDSFTDAAAGIVTETISLSKSGNGAEAQASVTVTGEFDGIAWREGSVVLGTENPIVFTATDFAWGTHYITVEVVRDDIPWSREFKLVIGW